MTLSLVVMPRTALATLAGRSRRQPESVFVVVGDGLPWDSGRALEAAAVFARDGLLVETNRVVSLILLSLAGARGNYLDHFGLGDAVWGDRADGGPDRWRDYLTVVRCQRKSIFAALGLRIVTVHGMGWRLEQDHASDLRLAPSLRAPVADLKPARVGPTSSSNVGRVGPASPSFSSDPRLSPASFAATVPSLCHVVGR